MATADVFRSKRRYLFAKSLKARLEGNEVYLAWDSKRKTMPGTSLPATFPARAALDASGYWALEDLQGASTQELVSAGLTTSQAAAVMAEIGKPDV